MGYWDIIKKVFRNLKKLTGKATNEIQPRDILDRLVAELERKKKLGIDENAFVPNVYVVYLSPFDYEEISPLLTGIRDQLRNKLMERTKKHGYRLLSASLTLDIREDGALQKGQVVIESSFLKEKITPVSTTDEKEKTTSFTPPMTRGEFKGDVASAKNSVLASLPSQKNTLTRIIEDKKTKIIDNTKLELEIVDGENHGEVIRLKEGEYTFGRGKDATILIRDLEETVSRVHFKVTVREGRIKIINLSNSNGTRVNDIDIEEAELKKGDTISAGKVQLKVA